MSAMLRKNGPFCTKIFAFFFFFKREAFFLGIQYFKKRQHLGSISPL